MTPLRLALALLLLTSASIAAEPAGCVAGTAASEAMGWATLRLPTQELRVKVADSEAERIAGMQHLCPSRVQASPMLFLLAAPRKPSFHMNNVHIALDIAFLDGEGTVLEIHRMALGGGANAGKLTSAALEAAAGRFAEWGLAVGDRVEWPHTLRGQ